MSRKAAHNEDEIIKTHDDSPVSFFKDAEQIFDKHFVKQCCSEKLVKFALASISEISTTFARWLLNLPIEKRSTSVRKYDNANARQSQGNTG